MPAAENLAEMMTAAIASRFAEQLSNNLVMARLIATNSNDSNLNSFRQGQTISVPLPPTGKARRLGANESVTRDNESVGSVDVTLDSHVYKSFDIPDVEQALAGGADVMDVYSAAAAQAVAEEMESDIFKLYPKLASRGTAGVALTEAVIDDAETTLFNNKAPDSEMKYLVVSGDGYSQLRQIPAFKEADKIGSGAALETGRLGQIKGFQVYRSQYVQKAGSGPVETNNMAFLRDGLVMATRPFRNIISGTGAISQIRSFGGFTVRAVMAYDANKLAQTFTVHVLYGVNRYRPNLAIRVLS
jgi:hypothetical protein